MAGAGLMGHGIAQVHAAIGRTVALYEPDLARAEAGRERIAGNLQRVRRQGPPRPPTERDAILGRIDADRRPRRRRATPTSSSRPCSRTSRSSTTSGATLDGQAPPEAIFASNTSSIAIHRLAEAVAPRAPRRGSSACTSSARCRSCPSSSSSAAPATADDTVTVVRDLSIALGKQVIVSADKPGFIVNRILMPFLIEAMRALEQGVGTAEDIDTGARVGLNHPMGPLELADFIGLDVCLGIIRVLEDGLGQEQLRASARCWSSWSAAGHLGQKTGQGFYTYPRG